MHPVLRSLQALLLLISLAMSLGLAAFPAWGASESAKETKSQKTFEGIEPLFYLDSKRRPYIEPFHKTETDEYFICRGTVGEWYRQSLAQDFNKLAARDGMPEVSGSTCALHLIATHSGKKLPIVAVEMFPGADDMRSCVLAGTCPQLRTVMLYVKDRTLYRTFILGDGQRRVKRHYCLDNQSKVLAEKTCWRHFEGD